MFSKLFEESGLSLDRLKTLIEAGAAGSIARAAANDPVRQSQYSRQIKELEDFFRVQLIERQGKGTRLTRHGKELARISRFFLLGLSNFQRGCLAQEQTFRLGASATFMQHFLVPILSSATMAKDGARYVTETAGDDEIERRLHDLTLDFGIVQRPGLSRPLQAKPLSEWTLELWAPKCLWPPKETSGPTANPRDLPLALARKEMRDLEPGILGDWEPKLECESFFSARAAMETQGMAVVLPDFLAPKTASRDYVRVPVPELEGRRFAFGLAWNPRLLRLNPPAAKERDRLIAALKREKTG